GLDQGKQSASYTIETAERPKSIKVIEQDKTVQVGDLAQIRIEIVDENNIPVLLSDNLITVQIEGSATLMGLESGSNTDMSDYTDDKHRVHHGVLLAYIRAEEPGKLNVNFTSPWLESASATIQVKP